VYTLCYKYCVIVNNTEWLPATDGCSWMYYPWRFSGIYALFTIV